MQQVRRVSLVHLCSHVLLTVIETPSDKSHGCACYPEGENVKLRSFEKPIVSAFARTFKPWPGNKDGEVLFYSSAVFVFGEPGRGSSKTDMRLS